jgi:MYXO-CTERM domain-containing protein
MPEGIITTRTVRATPDKRAVEVIASLDAGEVVPGMFVHIPLNGMLDFTVPVVSVSPAPDGGFSISGSGNDVVLHYSAAPEPGMVGVIGLATIVLLRRRSRWSVSGKSE